jgi:ABC-type transport system involved in multi-copper enzyme maturation permease subunit
MSTLATSTTPTAAPLADPTGAASRAAERAARVTARSVVRAEWIKFVSVRSNLVALVAAGAALVFFGTLFSSLAGSGEALPPNAAAGTDSLSMSFGGMNLSQLVLGVLGAVFVAGEYATGMIRTMFAAVADRLPVVRAKAIVLAAASWVTMTIASFVVFFTGQAVYAGDGATFGLGDDGVLRAVLGGGVYGAGIVLMGLALGFLLRSTAASIGTLVGTLMILPGLTNLLPDSVNDTIGKFLPSNAGQAFLSVAQSDTLLSPASGFAVFAAWTIGLLGLAAVVVRRRDA